MKASKQRNIFIILAVALSAFLLSAVFSLGITFYNVNSRQQMIAEGTNRDIIITNPEKEQTELAKSLPQMPVCGKSNPDVRLQLIVMENPLIME
mgnify:CR=1 FL=1